MLKFSFSLTALSITSCTLAQEDVDGSGFVVVNEVFWRGNQDTPYPFTTEGEISCGVHPEFGCAVYFEPVGFTDESYIGTPLNKVAAESLKQTGLKPNVPYRIETDANLSVAIEVGLRACD